MVEISKKVLKELLNTEKGWIIFEIYVFAYLKEKYGEVKTVPIFDYYLPKENLYVEVKYNHVSLSDKQKKELIKAGKILLISNIKTERYKLVEFFKDEDLGITLYIYEVKVEDLQLSLKDMMLFAIEDESVIDYLPLSENMKQKLRIAVKKYKEWEEAKIWEILEQIVDF